MRFNAPVLEEIPLPDNSNQGTIQAPSSTPLTTFTPSPTATGTPTQLPPSPTVIGCQPESGNLEEKRLETPWLSKPLEYRVYTPPCYEGSPENRYPVLYLIHGYGYNDDQWLRLGVPEIADKLINSGELPPFIIVLPHDRDHNNQPPENQFGEALIYDLVEAIDSSYRTLPSRQNRAIGGLSRGGNWAIHIGLDHWNVFGVIGAHSAPLFVSDGPSKVRDWLKEIPPDEYPRIFLDIGDKDKWLDHIIRFEELLDEYNISHELFIFPGGHTEDYWKAHTELYIRWYVKGW